MRYKIVQGDCVETMHRICGNESIDAVICDPPAGIGFMGKAWDKDKGGRRHWIAWMTDVASECLRVLRPGGHALVWALPRTSHWTATAWEDAGFDVRDCVYHHYGTGFPKGSNISKALDKAAGVSAFSDGYVPNNKNNTHGKGWGGGKKTKESTYVTDAGKQWAGWNVALKPATECWWLLRKPLSEKTVAKNILKHGVGGLNIGACRVKTGSVDSKAMERCNTPGSGRSKGRDPIQADSGHKGVDLAAKSLDTTQGRWPANLILSHHEDCECVGVKQATGSASGGDDMIVNDLENGYVKEDVEDWVCHKNCPIHILDMQSGVTKSTSRPRHIMARLVSVAKGAEYARITSGAADDIGGASRFFYCAKPSQRERHFGMPDGSKNIHPTVKSINLMQWLIRLITPPGGVLIDPFSGSGSTVLAAMLEGVDCIGCEKEEEYCEISKQRCKYAFEHLENLRNLVKKTKKVKTKKAVKSE